MIANHMNNQLCVHLNDQAWLGVAKNTCMETDGSKVLCTCMGACMYHELSSVVLYRETSLISATSLTL